MLSTRLPVVFLLGLLAFVAPRAALADSVTIEEVTMSAPEDGNSWWAPVTFSGSRGQEVDHLQAWVTDKYSQRFVHPRGIDRFDDDGGSWSQRHNDGSLLIARGDADQRFGMAFHFDGEYETGSIEFHVEFYAGEDLLRSVTWEWLHDKRIWYGTLNESSVMGGFAEVPVPEPESLLLFGLAAAGLVWMRRRRRLVGFAR